MWKNQHKAFSAVWRVPEGTGFDSLRIELLRRFMVILVRRGTILLSHGDTQFHLREGQAVAISVPEVVAQVPVNPGGDNIFEVHLFNRMPSAGKLGMDCQLGRMVSMQGYHPVGMFPYPDARALTAPVLPGDEQLESATALLLRLLGCGMASTVQFVASGQGRTLVKKLELVPASLAW